MRDLHRGHEKDEREKQRAKGEVERLNGVVSGASPSGQATWRQKNATTPSGSGARQATPAERKAQLAQLAAMGVAVPEDFRRETAMAGDWQTVSEIPVYDGDVKKEEDTKDVKPVMAGDNPSRKAFGVRKRKLDDEAGSADEGDRVVRKGWGSTIKPYPGANEDLDLDALLNGTKKSASTHVGANSQTQEPLFDKRPDHASLNAGEENPASNTLFIKREDSGPDGALTDLNDSADGPQTALKHEEEEPTGGVIFKKRKAKSIRQK